MKRRRLVLEAGIVLLIERLLVLAVAASSATCNGPFLMRTNSSSDSGSGSSSSSTPLPLKPYEYVLPLRRVVSCPSFATFSFACQPNHALSIEGLTFSPPLQRRSSRRRRRRHQSAPSYAADCLSDWSRECRDDSMAYEYASVVCSGRQSCQLVADELRARISPQCSQLSTFSSSSSSIISVYYKCVPTWEVRQVPAKCDVCKNVTIGSADQQLRGASDSSSDYGFIYSAWYEHNQQEPEPVPPMANCRSLIKNKPNHVIVFYAVSGSLGADRIRLESLADDDEQTDGVSVARELLTGNLTTRLVFASTHDVNLSVDTSQMQSHSANNRQASSGDLRPAAASEQRSFLLYFYVVHKCRVTRCPELTTSAMTTVTTSTTASILLSSTTLTVLTSSSSTTLQTTTSTTTTTTTPPTTTESTTTLDALSTLSSDNETTTTQAFSSTSSSTMRKDESFNHVANNNNNLIDPHQRHNTHQHPRELTGM